MSSSNYKKLFVFVIFLVLCLSVSYAANVTDDSTTDKIDTSVTAAETPSIEKESNIAKQTVKKEQNIKKESTRHIPGDPYTFENETLDITLNNYDGQTLTLRDNVNVISSNNIQLTGTVFVVNGNNVNVTGLKIENHNWNNPTFTVTGSNVNLIGNNITRYKTEPGEAIGFDLIDATNVTISDNNINGTGAYAGDIQGISITNSSSTSISNNNIDIFKSGVGDIQGILITNSPNTNISNNNLNIFKTEVGDSRGISIFNASNTYVSYNNITVHAQPQAAGWEYDNVTKEWIEHMKVSGIKAEISNNVTINNNIVTVTNSTTFGEVSSSADAITLKTCNDSNIENNNVTISGSDYIYGVSVSRLSNNIFIYNNTVFLSGKNYVCGIQLASSSNSHIKKNRVFGNCSAVSGQCPSFEAFAYGIIDLTGTYGSPVSEAVGNIIEENYVRLDSTIAYAYELSNTYNTQILNNNATVTGNVVMALGIYNSTNCNITGNLFNITGNTRTLNSSIYEAIPPVTTGIKITGIESTNIQITENNINVTESTSIETFAVILDEDIEGNVVSYNILKAKYDSIEPKYGNQAVSFNEDLDNTIENNS